MTDNRPPTKILTVPANRDVLPRQHIENAANRRRHPAIRTIRNDPQQLGSSIATLGRYDAKLGKVPAKRIAQHRALTHQQLPGPVQHQGSLLFLRLDWNKPHRRSRDRLADRCRIVRIVLAAFEIGAFT